MLIFNFNYKTFFKKIYYCLYMIEAKKQKKQNYNKKKHSNKLII